MDVNDAKCDENRPICIKCQRAQAQCIFQDLTAAEHNPFEPRKGRADPFEVLINTQAQISHFSPSHGLKIDQDHHIFEYYGYNVAGSVPMLSAVENMTRWNLAVQKHAFAQDYLRNSILAISCLHKAIHIPVGSSQDLLLAHHYQDLAIKQFVPTLSSVTIDNCEPALACAAMLCCITFAIPKAMDVVPNHTYDVIGNALQIISLFQGITVLFRMGWYYKLDNNISANMRRNVLESMDDQLPDPHLEASLDNLALVAERTLSAEKYAFYLSAMEDMKTNFRRRAARPMQSTLLAAFVVNMPKRYFEDVQRQEPVALVLLAHWAAGLHMPGEQRQGTNAVWWSRDWAESAVASITELMSQSWSAYLAWPRRRVGLRR